jgi:hypothetical protein
MRTVRTVLVSAVVAALVVIPVITAPAGAASAKYPNLVGTWTGSYRFPSGTDTAVDSHETLVIDRQDKELLWGHDEFVQNGQPIRIPVRGSIDLDGKGFGLAETSGLFICRIVRTNVIDVRFFRTDDMYTAFAARLTRTST